MIGSTSGTQGRYVKCLDHTFVLLSPLIIPDNEVSFVVSILGFLLIQGIKAESIVSSIHSSLSLKGFF